jgi:hypothetical protein
MVKVRLQGRPRGYFWNAVVQVSLGEFAMVKGSRFSKGVHTEEECAELERLRSNHQLV